MILRFWYPLNFCYTETRLVGVTRQTIISIESGKYTASLTLAMKIAKVFDKRVEEVFILEDGD